MPIGSDITFDLHMAWMARLVPDMSHRHSSGALQLNHKQSGGMNDLPEGLPLYVCRSPEKELSKRGPSAYCTGKHH